MHSMSTLKLRQGSDAYTDFAPGLEKRHQTRARQTTHGRIHERGVPFKVVVQPRPG